MKNTVISALMYLVIDFLWAFIVNIVIRLILQNEGGQDGKGGLLCSTQDNACGGKEVIKNNVKGNINSNTLCRRCFENKKRLARIQSVPASRNYYSLLYFSLTKYLHSPYLTLSGCS